MRFKKDNCNLKYDNIIVLIRYYNTYIENNTYDNFNKFVSLLNDNDKLNIEYYYYNKTYEQFIKFVQDFLNDLKNDLLKCLKIEHLNIEYDNYNKCFLMSFIHEYDNNIDKYIIKIKDNCITNIIKNNCSYGLYCMDYNFIKNICYMYNLII